MITITCTNCRASLTMDEAFAGGVCRCQHCGTIQTVPKSARDGGEASGLMGHAEGTSKTLWRQKSTTEATPGTGLDDLADVVASSGLAGSGLQSKRLRHSAPPTEEKKKKSGVLIGGIAGGVVALILLLVWLFAGGGTSTPADGTGTAGPGQTGGTQTPTAPAGPNFAGVKLDAASTVIFVLDRGSGTKNVFSDLKLLTLQSIKSLTADRKFQILFWEVHGEVVAYPETNPTVAGDISLTEASRKLDDVAAIGSSSIGPALKKAAAANPSAIIIATGKGDDLDDKFIAEVDANRPPGAKIYTFALGYDHPVRVLQTIAAKTVGEYRTISDAQLRELTK